MTGMTTVGNSVEIQSAWITTIRRYIVFIAGANFVWEVAQLPLYTIWTNGSTGE